MYSCLIPLPTASFQGPKLDYGGHTERLRPVINLTICILHQVSLVLAPFVIMLSQLHTKQQIFETAMYQKCILNSIALQNDTNP